MQIQITGTPEELAEWAQAHQVTLPDPIAGTQIQEVADLLAGVKGAQRDLLRALPGHGGKMVDKEVRALLNRQNLRGLLTPISRRCKKLGLPPVFVAASFNRTADGTGYFFEMAPDWLAAFKAFYGQA
jgi:hypothetical protein